MSTILSPKFDALCGLEIDHDVGIFVRGLRSGWVKKIRVCGRQFNMYPVQSPTHSGPIPGFYNIKIPASIQVNEGDVVKLSNDKKTVKYVVESAHDMWLVGEA